MPLMSVDADWVPIFNYVMALPKEERDEVMSRCSVKMNSTKYSDVYNHVILEEALVEVTGKYFKPPLMSVLDVAEYDEIIRGQEIWEGLNV